MGLAALHTLLEPKLPESLLLRSSGYFVHKLQVRSILSLSRLLVLTTNRTIYSALYKPGLRCPPHI